MAENLERVGGNAGNLVVRPIHNKFDAPGRGAKFAIISESPMKGNDRAHCAQEVSRSSRIVVIRCNPRSGILGLVTVFLIKHTWGKPAAGVLILRPGAVHWDLLVLENAPQGMFPPGADKY